MNRVITCKDCGKESEYTRRWGARCHNCWKKFHREEVSRNRTKDIERYREQHRNQTRSWRTNNQTWREKHHIATVNLRSKTKWSGGQISLDQWFGICDTYDNRCVCCGRKTKLHIDHITPVSKGGVTSIENIQPLCKSCNSKKGVKETDYRLDFFERFEIHNRRKTAVLADT